MPFIRLQDVKPGMAPIEDIKDSTGRVILNAGTQITLKHIKTLKAWGITEVLVGDVQEEIEVDNREDIEVMGEKQLKKEMVKLFHFTDPRHPFIKQLFISCLARKNDS